ncbi:MAG: hypothetical protein MHMPM18_002794 [Marteilia pararefringens]
MSKYLKNYGIPLQLILLLPLVRIRKHRCKPLSQAIANCLLILALSITYKKFVILESCEQNEKTSLDVENQCTQKVIFKISGHATYFYILIVTIFRLIGTKQSDFINSDHIKFFKQFYFAIICFCLYEFKHTISCFHTTSEMVLGLLIPFFSEMILNFFMKSLI